MSAGARSGRIERRFAALQSAGRGGLITFVTAGDPDIETSAEILRRLPAAGADFIELGAPFSDPMADGPAIQASSLRALKAGQTMRRTLDMVGRFRGDDAETPIILMGYYNPVYAYGVDHFMDDAAGAGVDGLILVDLPPEEAEEALTPARRAGVDVIFLTAPTTDAARLPTVVANAQGFIYHVSVAGVTGTRSAALDDVERAVVRIRAATDLPIAVGFGIRTAEQASAIARIADAAVVGSALVQTVAARIEGDGDRGRIADDVCALASELGRAIRATGPEPKVGS